jgi:hypothetical protein
MSEITKETFEKFDTDSKLNTLFDYHSSTSLGIKNIESLLQGHPKDCEKRFTKLEKTKIKNTAFSAAMGFVGGFVAMLTKLKFWG